MNNKYPLRRKVVQNLRCPRACLCVCVCRYTFEYLWELDLVPATRLSPRIYTSSNERNMFPPWTQGTRYFNVPTLNICFGEIPLYVLRFFASRRSNSTIRANASSSRKFYSISQVKVKTFDVVLLGNTISHSIYISRKKYIYRNKIKNIYF